MSRNINKYILSDNITNELLIENNFRKIVYKDNNDIEYEYIFYKQLYDTICLKISILLINNEFFIDCINVFDDKYGITYHAFYSLDDIYIVNKYNVEMDKLSNLGIFRKEEKVLIKEM